MSETPSIIGDEPVAATVVSDRHAAAAKSAEGEPLEKDDTAGGLPVRFRDATDLCAPSTRQHPDA